MAFHQWKSKPQKKFTMKHKNDEHHDEFDMTGITEA